MKVTLDLAALRAEGKISQAEYDKLLRLSHRETGSLGINVVIGFGVIAVAVGALALVPSANAGLAIGLALLIAGALIIQFQAQQWGVLGTICVLIGALLLSGGIVILGSASVTSFLLVAALLTGAGILARSGLLVAGAVIALAAALGARTGYSHALYSLSIYEPALTVLLFSALALATFLLSKAVPHAYARLSLAAARTSVLLVNFGFWVGSLWGDNLKWLTATPADYTRIRASAVIPDWAFVVGWALALIAAGAWAASANRRWLLNVVAVFAAIHFYTQWFARLGATPVSILAAGLLMLAFAFVMWKFNQRLERTDEAAAAAEQSLA